MVDKMTENKVEKGVEKKYLILDRDNTLGYFVDYKKGNVPLNPEIKHFLQKVREEGFITVLATGGSEKDISRLNEIAGLTGLFDHCYGPQTLANHFIDKDLLRLPGKFLPEFMTRSVMIGNDRDIESTTPTIPLIQVQYDKNSSWDVWKTYQILQDLYKDGGNPSENFDRIFAGGMETPERKVIVNEFCSYKTVKVQLNNQDFYFVKRQPILMNLDYLLSINYIKKPEELGRRIITLG